MTSVIYASTASLTLSLFSLVPYSFILFLIILLHVSSQIKQGRAKGTLSCKQITSLLAISSVYWCFDLMILSSRYLMSILMCIISRNTSSPLLMHLVSHVQSASSANSIFYMKASMAGCSPNPCCVIAYTGNVSFLLCPGVVFLTCVITLSMYSCISCLSLSAFSAAMLWSTVIYRCIVSTCPTT